MIQDKKYGHIYIKTTGKDAAQKLLLLQKQNGKNIMQNFLLTTGFLMISLKACTNQNNVQVYSSTYLQV